MSLGKILVNSAKTQVSKPNLSQPAILTTDFFTPRVIYTHEFVPGEAWKCTVNGMTRCNPLSKPVYADVKNNVRAFFVPMRTLWFRWNAYIANSPDGLSTPSSVFTVTPWVIIDALTRCDTENVVTSTFFEPEDTQFKDKPEPIPSAYDIAYLVRAPEGSYTGAMIKTVKFGRLASQMYNTLLGLGYNINTYDREHCVDDTDDVDNPFLKPITAMPILAFAKVWADYYVSPRDPYLYNQIYQQLNQFYSGSVTALTDQRLIAILAACGDINYKQDLFTTAWENPNGPDSGAVVSGFTLEDPALRKNNDRSLSVDARLNSIDNGLSPRIRSDRGNETETVITQYLDTALHKVADMLERYKLVGIRPADRYLTERGIKLRSEYLNRSIYIGHGESEFKITDTTSLGDIDSLGQFKGEASDYNLNINFDFDSEEFGFIICLSTVVPEIKYFNGMPRYMHHTLRNHFFNPTFDKLGVQGIRADELVNGINQVYGSYYTGQLDDDPYQGFADDDIIGYHDRFYEYKTNCTGLLLGDFALNSRNEGMDVWHLWRDINKRTFLDADFRAAYDRKQYDRFFAVQDGQNEGFIQLFHFSVKPTLPMAPLFDSYEWSEPDAKKVQVKPNGEYNV